MQVKDIMKTDIQTLSSSATLREAIEKFYYEKIGGLIVVDDNETLVGIVTEKDIYRALYPSYEEFMHSPESYTNFKEQEHTIHDKENILINKIMTTNPIVTSPSTYLMKIGALMLAQHIHRMPVVDDKHKLVGVISRGMVFRALFRKELGLSK